MSPAPHRSRLAALVSLALVVGCSARGGCSLACGTNIGDRELVPLCGTWQSRGKDDASTEERWSVDGEGLIGEGRTVDRSGAVISRESMSLRRGPEGSIYRATPDGAAATEFVEVRDPGLISGAHEQVWVWENLAHDFPRRIVYRVADDRLEATVSDPDAADEAKRRGITWEFRRVAPCGP